MNTITQSELKQILYYSPETGEFVWRKSVAKHIKEGDIAGTVSILNQRATHLKYRQIKINGKLYLAHRLAFLYMDNLDVSESWVVDHTDGDGLNNAWSNLRMVNRKLNAENIRMYRNNTSGHMGVSWNKSSGKWLARIGHNGKLIYLGRFPSVEEAANVYESKRKELFKHNEGRHLQ